MAFEETNQSLFPLSYLIDENDTWEYDRGRFWKGRKENGENDHPEVNDSLFTRPFSSFEIKVKSEKEEKALKDFFSSSKPSDCLDMNRMGCK